ncbi:ribonuclease III [Nitrosomonas sp. HPC101]|uniref:ribonuclease III n=1 Tax=Nitrosomonas sp. HPC101 TaxID=1658667 RepID=UPI00136DB74E|nr:ribonuclease III [Nitrosomonas sp. HPC101]MXS85158.1 ribonuclease III [Nitrosomonas sp. HPC101]
MTRSKFTLGDIKSKRIKKLKEQDYTVFFQKLGYTFKQPNLLQEALTHRSLGFPNNERLEFLGDSVLNCAVSTLLFKHFPQLPEGGLTRLRANFVNQEALHQLASTLDIGGLILLGDGERKSGGHKRPSILANAMEAIIGAIYLESGFAKVDQVIIALYDPLLKQLDPDFFGKDPKTLLQEYLQSQKVDLPEYSTLLTRGDAHARVFHVECVIPEFAIRTSGEGTSRRRAEQEAARRAYKLAVVRH